MLAEAALSAGPDRRQEVERAIVAARQRWEGLPESGKDRAISRALEAARREFWMGFLPAAERKVALAHRHMDAVERGARHRHHRPRTPCRRRVHAP